MKFPQNKISGKITSGNILTDITDHLPTFVLINNYKHTDQKDRPHIRILNDENIAKFNQDLNNVDWSETLGELSPDDMCDKFYEILKNAYERNFPLVKLSRKKAKDKPWITKGLKKATDRKNNLYVKQLKNPTHNNIIEILYQHSYQGKS